ncbi:MAG: hypothetical protein JXB36_19675 [Gammaproteobacteria bacterium]|nr:hypothetical protein [Gammaproteobacteria bacterium]
MNTTTKSRKQEQRRNGRFSWIFSETTIGLVILASVLPAVVHGVLSLNNLPVV